MKLKTIFDLSFVNIKHSFYKISGQTHRIVPYKVLVELTTQCNSRCITCDIWKIEKKDLKKIDLAHLQHYLSTMGNHLKWLALSGGEISNFGQFPELVALIKQYSPQLRILTFTTNGLLPQRILQFAKLMKEEIGCDIFITISLDGDEETHDRLRGVKGNYAKCMETYQLLKDNQIDCHFGITLSEDNHGFVNEKYKDYRNEMKAITLFHSGGIFLNPDNPTNQASEKKILESLKNVYRHYRVTSLGEALIKLYLKLGILFLMRERKENVIPCDVGYSSVHLMANGNLHQCMFLPEIANIRDGFSLDSYQTPKAKALLEDIRKNKCPHCWMGCYGPHNMLQSPLKTLGAIVKNK